LQHLNIPYDDALQQKIKAGKPPACGKPRVYAGIRLQGVQQKSYVIPSPRDRTECDLFIAAGFQAVVFLLLIT
jgi:hypothetical protein